MKKSSDLLDKKKVLRSIKEMPDRFSADEVIERIMLLKAVEEGLADIEAGRVLTLDEAKKRHAKWLK